MRARLHLKYRSKYGANFLFALLFLCYGCIEEFKPETEFYESVLVVEAVVTDEIKVQEILLSRSFRFEEENPMPERNATVRIIDNEQIEYTFNEVEPGRYLSTEAFAAVPEKEYILRMETRDGNRYSSTTSKLTGAATIEAVNAVVATNQENVPGVSLQVETFDPTGNSRYYRFDYEETYKILAPKWANVDAVSNDGIVSFQPKTSEQQICYNTLISDKIILASTNGQREDGLIGFPVRFIEQDDYFIAHRYSILVHQYVISSEAFGYYSYLADLSTSGSIFSESQPGFLGGNIIPDNGDEKVLGYFEVSATTTKRIFFNHSDLFSDDHTPSYPNSCEGSKPRSEVAIPLLRSGDAKYFMENNSPGQFEGPYVLVARVCGDCTVLGDNVVPDFWEE